MKKIFLENNVRSLRKVVNSLKMKISLEKNERVQLWGTKNTVIVTRAPSRGIFSFPSGKAIRRYH